MLGGGLGLLNHSAAQARDTIRKHHLADIERSLYLARDRFGTFPPYDAPTWCGLLSEPSNESTRQHIEAALRFQNEQYANQAKPFPQDPGEWGYYYIKRSPAIFELYAHLEAAPTREKNSFDCQNAPPQFFDYGLTSVWREHSPLPPAL